LDLSQNRLPPVPRTARGEGVRGHAPFREASRNASKGGGAENGVERRAEPRAIKGGPHARLRRSPGGPCSRCFLFFSLGSCSRLHWSPFLSLVHALAAHSLLEISRWSMPCCFFRLVVCSPAFGGPVLVLPVVQRSLVVQLFLWSGAGDESGRRIRDAG